MAAIINLAVKNGIAFVKIVNFIIGINKYQNGRKVAIKALMKIEEQLTPQMSKDEIYARVLSFHALKRK